VREERNTEDEIEEHKLNNTFHWTSYGSRLLWLKYVNVWELWIL